MTSFTKLQQENDLHLHDDAIALMLEALDGVKRYHNNPIVTPDYTITSRAHIERLYNDPHHILRDSTNDFPHFADALKASTLRRYQVHEFDEVICEQLTALEETHPAWRNALQGINPRAIQKQISRFFYQLALYSCHTGQPDLFRQTIARARRETGIQENGFGMKEKTPENLVHFYTTLHTLMQPDTGWQDWNRPEILQQIDTMQYYYDSVEYKTDFLGSFCQAIEKLDGSHYVGEVHNRKIQEGTYTGGLLCDYTTDVLPRVSTRYEGILFYMHQQVKTAEHPELERLYQAIADNTARAIYRVLRNSYQHGPAETTHRDRIFAQQDILNFYDDLLANDNITLPPENGIALDLLVG